MELFNLPTSRQLGQPIEPSKWGRVADLIDPSLGLVTVFEQGLSQKAESVNCIYEPA